MIKRRLKERWIRFTGGKKDTDGCAIDFRPAALTDEQAEAFVLFADVDPDDIGAVQNRADEWALLEEHKQRALGEHQP